MVKALSKKNHEYVCKEDRGKENPTVFLIRILDKATKAECVTFAQKTPDADLENIEFKEAMDFSKKAFLAGVKEIRNLETDDGVKNITEINEDVLEIIPDEVINEVSAEILRMTVLNKDQVKN